MNHQADPPDRLDRRRLVQEMGEGEAIRNFIGMVLAWHRGDDDAFRVLREAHLDEQREGRDFHVTAFGTIVHLAREVARISGKSPEAIMEHVRSESGPHMMATVAECALAALADDRETFNRIGEAASGDPDFIPAELHTTIWLAKQIGLSEGRNVEAVLSDMAMVAAIGEAGLFDE
jgi:hypothetical protein